MYKHYIRTDNKKALDFFKGIGATLTSRDVRISVCDHNNDVVATIDKIIVVSHKDIDNMSRSAFHKYLKSHKLLMMQQSY